MEKVFVLDEGYLAPNPQAGCTNTELHTPCCTFFALFINLLNFNMLHATLAQGRWFELTLAQQLANVGSEVHRLIIAHKKNDMPRFDAAFDRALELIDLTLADPRWKTGYKEIARVREVLCDIYFGENQYDTPPEALDDYFFKFALVPS